MELIPLNSISFLNDRMPNRSVNLQRKASSHMKKYKLKRQ